MEQAEAQVAQAETELQSLTDTILEGLYGPEPKWVLCKVCTSGMCRESA